MRGNNALNVAGNAQPDGSPQHWLVGGGEMGKLVRSLDWSKTPLGPIESWPQSLRTTVGLCLASNFPISLAWGPHHIQIYNDGYWPICAAKHPHSMGQNFTECWASPWPVIGESFRRALGGETSFLEDQRMFLDRNGYPEETFFTFSFSPVRDESGGVGGLFHPVTETTAKMVGERRTRVLRDLAARVGRAKSSDEAFLLSAQTLSEYNFDFPFAQVYRIDGDKAWLVAQSGPLPQVIAPSPIDLAADQTSTWPLAEAVRTEGPIQIDRLEERFGAFSCGPYPEAPKTALAYPITPAGCDRPVAILILGLSSRLPFGDAYGAFCDLIGATVTSGLANARAYEEERKRAEALAELDRAKTEFFSNVSHEFRTPLTLMLGPLEDELSEQSQPLPIERRERLQTAHRNTLRLLKLVNTLLDFSRSEASRIEANYEPIELAAFTAELASVFRSVVDKAGLTLTVECPPLPEPIYVDRDMWEKIVLNLLSNAFKHTFAGGIRVTLTWDDQQAKLTVADTGVGIPAAELPMLFDRFHRVKGTKSRSHEGTGIGLALVQELVRIHSGTVEAASREGEGSVFTVKLKGGCDHLPTARLAETRNSSSTAIHAAAFAEEALQWVGDRPGKAGLKVLPDEEDEPEPENKVKARILWADDNADMRDYIRRLLAKKYDVIAVSDGAAALQAAFEVQPDLVLTDVMMPGLDGFGLLRELRRDPRTKTLPVIVLSARAGEEAAIEGLEAGADDYLVKPFSARELMARVRTHLDLARLRREWANELEMANKELEAFSYSVSHDLRAPLRAVNGFASMIQRDVPSLAPTSQRHLQQVISAAKQMGELIDALLNLARFSKQSLVKKPVKIADLAQEVFDELHKLHPERKVEFRVGPLPDCNADYALIRQVVTNLIGNAFKFTRRKDRTQIEVSFTGSERDPVYFVKDNGVGFEQKYAGKLFGVFERLHRADEFEGTGIGLSIVRRIINRHGGRVWVEAELDDGATFYFTLPR